MKDAQARQSYRNRIVILLVYVGFISLGLPDGLIGVGWPAMRQTFALPVDALGGLLLLFTVGYLASSFQSGQILQRISIGLLLAGSCVATSASLLGFVIAPSWSFILMLGIIGGLGAGAIDAGLNTFAAQ